MLKELVEKEISVELKLTKSNITEDDNLFYAEDIYDATMTTPTPSESLILSNSSSVKLVVDVSECYIFHTF